MFTRYMFWSEWGENAKIRRLNLDKPADAAVDIVTASLVYPNGLTLDESSKALSDN